MQQIRGVNLGGWLVLERWITPSIFEGTQAADEHSLVTELGLERASKLLQQHRKTFITEQHIAHIYRLGLTTVRVPVGYWLFDSQDGYCGGAGGYIENIFGWANKYELKVILCLHAAPGSQNGWDHSGRAGDIYWSEAVNIEHTYNFLVQLAEQYGQERALLGIEVLNEPHWSISLDTLCDFYRRAGEMIENICHKHTYIIVSDAFRAKDMIKRIPRLGLQNIVLDCHLYQLFTEEDRALDLQGHLAKVRVWETELKRYAKKAPVLIGEWSAAMDELYQVGDGGRTHVYTIASYKAYAHIQQEVFSSAQVGWCYWTARTEDGGIWSLLDHPELLTSA